MTKGLRLFEAILAPGLEAVTEDELLRMFGPRVTLYPAHALGSVRFEYSGRPQDLLALKTVLAVSLIRHFPVPRPKALLGDQNLRAMLDDIETARSLFPRDAFATFYLSAAGADSPVMARLKETLSAKTGLIASSTGDLQIRLRRNGDGWEVLTRLSPRPLATRSWRVCHREGGLDASVAHAMILLTQPSAGDVFVNLCCGSGTLLIERLARMPASLAAGCDIDTEALLCARANVDAAGYSGKVELTEWDARAIPLPDCVTDAIVADLPFGTRVGSHAQNMTLYPAILREAARVAKPGARFCLLTGELRLMTELLERSPHWSVEQSLRIRLAGLVPALFVLQRREG